MSQVSETPPPSSPPPTMSPTALHRWRQRIAGALLLVGGIVLLASYFLPWSSGSQVPGLDICPTCTPKVFTTSAWSLINPLAVHWDSIFLAVTRGEFSPLLAYAIATFLQLVVPALLMFLGWRLLVRATSMRLHWQVLIVLYSVAELLVARPSGHYHLV